MKIEIRMKKILCGCFAGLAALGGFAQTETPSRMVLHFKNGEIQCLDLKDIDYVDFDDLGADTPDPKVGDYFYSDGTWSDGGLVSIDPDGCNAVWAASKPSPVEGKTVIGIVFSTDPGRIAEEDAAAGFTHGYVIGCRNIQDPAKANFALWPETVWYAGMYANKEVIPVSKFASTCYKNLSGRTETATMLEKQDPQYIAEDVPMFYYGTTGYPVEAPSTTSGWFIPSVGQMWDCIANFCSGEVAEFLASNRQLQADFTYNVSSQMTTQAPFDDFMRPFELVSPADKDEITIADGNDYICIGTSSRYDSESRVVFNLGRNADRLVEGMAEWFDGEAHARPVLAF